MSSVADQGQPQITGVRAIIGMEVHVELACASKAFSRAPSPASRAFEGAPPNTCLDAVVLGLPGALPVVNDRAVEMSIAVGLALGCSIAPVTRWDRKSYFYADMPKGYQISQFDLPLCFDGALDYPAPSASPSGGAVTPDHTLPPLRAGIIRAHLEEDAGKLLHEAPGGAPIEHSIVDFNRTGTALLEIVTQPDFASAEQAVLFCQTLRALCRHLGVTQGVMQKGHMRFEPNINCELTLASGRTVRTPITEVKNLNSFKAVRGAILHELREQPQRWLNDGRTFGPGTKQTRGWDDASATTFVQRQKEDAHDYRYFPDPDLLPVHISPARVQRAREQLPELPRAKRKRYDEAFGLGAKECAALVEEPAVARLMDDAVEASARAGVPATRAGKLVGNLLLQSGLRRANERSAEVRRAQQAGEDDADGAEVLVSDLGVTPEGLAGIAALRDAGAISAQGADELFGLCTTLEPQQQSVALIEQLAREKGLVLLRDDAQIDAWARQAIEANPQPAADVRAGKDAAIGRIVGAAMKLAAGQGDAAVLRERILKQLRG